MTFALCELLEERYAALVFDPDAVRCVTTGPGILFWTDEHPEGDRGSNCHRECSRSVAQLCEARAAYWRTGAVPANLETLWQEALKLLPKWPGFARMELSAEARRDFVQSERDAAAYGVLESRLAAGAEFAQWESRGGGRRTKLTIEVHQGKRPWWRFWS
jgi:hypothetical protein